MKVQAKVLIQIRPKVPSQHRKHLNDSSDTNPAAETSKLTIWVDADACPNGIKDILLRTSKRLSLPLVFVANQSVRIPQSSLVSLITVRDGADVADDLIAEKVQPNDVVITQDIPLAARVIEKDASAIGVRGQLYDDNSIQSRLGTRNLMEQFRAAGMETSGPKPLNQKDVQTFANALDRTLTKALRRR